ncbi:MAG: (d)CMP kinase [Pseudomonadota bacterium]
MIAIDGPAASGKGTLGRSLALHYGLDYLDTGKIYRAVAWRLIQNGSCPTCLDDALQACQHIIAAGAADMMHQLAQPSLLLDDVATIASQIAAITPVREALQKIQRDFATEPPQKPECMHKLEGGQAQSQQ